MQEYKEIPLLTARDVELRVARQTDSNVTLLVYKDARVDMRILDECFGPLNWKRSHEVINGNNYCTVSVKDPETGEWISKQDVGKPSNTEAEKGEASDSFKRACFNWGIGRELYDAPDIKIKLESRDVWTPPGSGKKVITTKFKVVDMVYNKMLGTFDKFTVVDNNGNVRFSLDAKPETVKKAEKMFGCVAEKVESYVRKTDESYEVRSKKTNQWVDVRGISIERLNDILNDKDYDEAHQFIFEVMVRKSGKKSA